MRPVLMGLCAGLCLSACSPEDKPVLRFVALGDAPYGEPAQVHPPYRALLQNINAATPPVVVHVGDTHGDRTCNTPLMKVLRGFMDEISAPVLYTPGDNEWTDCGGKDSEVVLDVDPLERLSYLRKTYFQTNTTLGANPVPVQNQAARGYPENARLRVGSVGFITLHVVGSNNNFRPDNLEAVKEFMARNAANVAWLSDSMDHFADADAIVVALHADMFTPLSGFHKGWHRMSPYRDIGILLGQKSSAMEKPVLLLYGDSHQHKVFQPFPKYRPYLHAIEVYGFPDIKAIEIAVDPTARKPFTVSRVISP